MRIKFLARDSVVRVGGHCRSAMRSRIDSPIRTRQFRPRRWAGSQPYYPAPERGGTTARHRHRAPVVKRWSSPRRRGPRRERADRRTRVTVILPAFQGPVS